MSDGCFCFAALLRLFRRQDARALATGSAAMSVPVATRASSLSQPIDEDRLADVAVTESPISCPNASASSPCFDADFKPDLTDELADEEEDVEPSELEDAQIFELRKRHIGFKPFAFSAESALGPGMFSITVDRTGRACLGIDVNLEDGVTLQVESVSEGLIKQWNEVSVHTQVMIGDRIVQINGAMGDAQQILAEGGKYQLLDMTLVRKNSENVSLPCGLAYYTITVDRTGGPSLGIDCDFEDGVTLLVKSLKEGIIHQWNVSNQGAQVEAGDRIVEINGERGNAQRLLHQAKGDHILCITFSRNVSNATADGIPAADALPATRAATARWDHGPELGASARGEHSVRPLRLGKAETESTCSGNHTDDQWAEEEQQAIPSRVTTPLCRSKGMEVLQGLEFQPAEGKLFSCMPCHCRQKT